MPTCLFDKTKNLLIFFFAPFVHMHHFAPLSPLVSSPNTIKPINIRNRKIEIKIHAFLLPLNKGKDFLAWVLF